MAEWLWKVISSLCVHQLLAEVSVNLKCIFAITLQMHGNTVLNTIEKCSSVTRFFAVSISEWTLSRNAMCCPTCPYGDTWKCLTLKMSVFIVLRMGTTDLEVSYGHCTLTLGKRGSKLLIFCVLKTAFNNRLCHVRSLTSLLLKWSKNLFQCSSTIKTSYFLNLWVGRMKK